MGAVMAGAVMQASAEDYHGQLLGLRPVGPAWPEDDNLLRGAADGLARVHARTLRLIEEADPRTTEELLPAWETFAGLPDSCTANVRLTLAERRAALVGRLTARGGQSRRYFRQLAAAVGFPDASVTEFRPFRVDSRCTDAINPDPWRHAWLLSVPDDGGLTVFDAGSPCTSPVRAWGLPVLECAVRRVQPAHAHVLFGYGAVPRPEMPDEDEGEFVVPQAGVPQQSVAMLPQGGSAEETLVHPIEAAGLTLEEADHGQLTEVIRRLSFTAPVRQPRNVSPVAGAIGLGETPILTASPYYSLYGLPQGGARFEISQSESFSSILFTGETVGPWSVPTSFTTRVAAGSATLTAIGMHAFTVPAGVYRIRVKVVAGGGSGGTDESVNDNGPGIGGTGGGGGVAVKEYLVTPGDTFSAVVPAGGNNSNGGTASFGSMQYATGGQRGLNDTNGGDGTIAASGQGFNADLTTTWSSSLALINGVLYGRAGLEGDSTPGFPAVRELFI